MKERSKSFGNGQMAFHVKSLAPGIARGKAFLLKRIDFQQFQKNKHTVDLVSSELARLDFAVFISKDQISRLMKSESQDETNQTLPIFEAELRFLKDPSFVAPVKKTIEDTSFNSESVLAEEIVRLQENIITATDEFTVKSLNTMIDLYSRLLYNMLPAKEGRISSLLKIPAGSILVADRLTPVEVAVLPMDRVVGILIEESSPYSHSSIMARTLGVPVVIGLAGVGSLLDESTDLLIDAHRGYVFINPSEETAKECENILNRHNAAAQKLAGTLGDESKVNSADGYAMHLLCNASTLKDVQLARDQGIKEIGLFRSEIRYLVKTVLPSDQQEMAYYTELFGVEGIDSITIRLLDMGGDKLPIYMQMTSETDPQLGCRGIRFLLLHPDLMKKQIRTVLASSHSPQVRLLLPFVTTVDDLKQAREIIDQVFVEMKITGDTPQIGVMIEVPSAALSIQQFLPKVDFVCLGTNDLIQYFFAVNRDQVDLWKYNRFTHPAFLKMLNEIITTCNKHGTHLTVCGEMASDPIGSCLLAALGATNFSVQPESVHHVRHAISKFNVNALKAILPVLFEFGSADEVEQKMLEVTELQSYRVTE